MDWAAVLRWVLSLRTSQKNPKRGERGPNPSRSNSFKSIIKPCINEENVAGHQRRATGQPNFRICAVNSHGKPALCRVAKDHGPLFLAFAECVV